MYAMLGEVRFELLNSFTSLETQHAANFAKHEVLKGRPRLQALQNELTTLRFSLKLHWRLGNPDTAYKGLLSALEAQQAVSLVYGSGRFVGWFVLERLTERTLIQDAQGRTAARELDVELTQFVGDPNNPLPTPAVKSGGQNPLLSLLPESVQAKAGKLISAVEKGVKIYRGDARWRRVVWVINKLFFWQRNHCRGAYAKERVRRMQFGTEETGRQTKGYK